MRSTFLCILGLVATSIATPSGFEPAGDLLPLLIPKVNKRQVSVVDGLRSREIGGGFIAVIPKDTSIPADGEDDGSSTRRRRILRDEVVVPETLQDKRAVYYCKNSGYGLCPGNRYCCPIGGLCCSDGGCCKKGQHCCRFDGCCPSTHNCVIVDGQEGCCTIGKICTATGNGCADSGYVPCSNYNFCCKPGYTCYRDSLGTNLCRAPTYDYTTTKRTTTTTTTTTAAVYKPTTLTLPDDTTTTDIQAQQVTDTTTPPSFATTTPPSFATTTPPSFATTTPTPAANSTSSAPRTSSSVDIPIGSKTNGATAVTSGVACSALLATIVFALGHVLVLA